MSEPIEWPSEPPVDGELPPPPEDGRAVAGIATRIGGLALEVILLVCTFGFGWVGWWIIAWADGQTPSKVLLHVHTVRADDGRLASFGQMAIREAFGKAPAGLAFGFGLYYGELWLASIGVAYAALGSAFATADPRRRTLWDRLAGTVVVEGDPPRPDVANAAEISLREEESTALG
jgi:uncharacterized RDD family membrane protein YckC